MLEARGVIDNLPSFASEEDQKSVIQTAILAVPKKNNCTRARVFVFVLVS